VYGKTRSSLFLLLWAPFALLVVVFRHVGMDAFDRLVLTFIAVVGGGLGVFVGCFAGRKTVYLYEDHLEVRGPLATVAHRHFRLSLWTARIFFRDIVALGRSAFEPPQGSFLIVHRKLGSRTRKFTLEGVPLAKYLDLKSELLKRIPPGCTLYSTKGFGTRGPF
jgi:hypothetical protein